MAAAATRGKEAFKNGFTKGRPGFIDLGQGKVAKKVVEAVDTKTAAEEVSKLFKNSVIEPAQGKDWKIKFTENNNNYVIRIMDAGSGQRIKPYYRVGIADKGCFSLDGKLTSDSALNHIDLSNNYWDQIREIINKVGKRP